MCISSRSVRRFGRPVTVARESRLNGVLILPVEGPLHVPVCTELRHKVRAFLRRGERTILLNLAKVPDVDAGGLGELVRVYNIASAANAVLRVTGANGSVREVLDRAGLLGLLTR